MVPEINKVKTGEQIAKYMKLRGLTVKEVKDFLLLGCVQSVYHWLAGKSIPSTDNLYALSQLLDVPMDELVIGDGDTYSLPRIPEDVQRLMLYCQYYQEKCLA